jgi:hypothetical protein
MKPHKWAKEIKAWADGAEIQFKLSGDWHNWMYNFEPLWDIDEYEYRIKPQPKAPQYLYVYRTSTNGQIEYRIYHDKDAGGALLGKIKLETEE